jgi:uncharacterized LabA/DUF88 family protein
METMTSSDMMRDQRLGVFVDVQNLFYSAKTIHHSKINYEKLLQMIVKGRKLIRALAYIVQKEEDNSQQAFIEVLNRLGYEVKSKNLRVRPDGTAKGDWDMGIAIDTISLVDKLDAVALVSGDGDFAPLVEMLKARGSRVEVYSFKESTSVDLMNAATSYTAFSESILFREHPSRDRDRRFKKK